MRSKKAFYNILSSLLLQIITIICGFIIPKLIIETYGSKVNGLTASIAQFLSYITLLEAGIGGVARSVLYKPLAKKDKRKISVILKTTSAFFRKIAFFFILYLLIVAIVYPLITLNQFDYMFSFSLIIVIGLSTIAQYFFGITYQLLLQADQKQYIYSIIQSVSLIINAIIVALLVYLKCDIILVKLASSAIFVIRPILLSTFVKKKYDIETDCEEDKNVLSKKRDGLAQHIAYFLHTNTDIVVITLFLSIEEVSVYSIYYMVTTGIKHIVNIFSTGIEAVFGNMLANDEKDNLRKKFKMVDVFTTIIASILFTTAIITVESFMTVYTKGISDAEYHRPLLGIFLILAELVYCIRIPYNALVVGAGHFKETKLSAYIEAGINIILSVILVNLFGIYGVALATLIAMMYRTTYLILYLSKNLIKQKATLGIKKLAIVSISSLISIIFCQLISQSISINNILDWILFALLSFIIVLIVTITISFFSYKEEFEQMFIVLKKITHRKRK